MHILKVYQRFHSGNKFGIKDKTRVVRPDLGKRWNVER